MTPKSKTRITFDFDSEQRKSYEKLAQIVCSSHWGSGIDIFGLINENHRQFFDFIKLGVIVIDEECVSKALYNGLDGDDDPSVDDLRRLIELERLAIKQICKRLVCQNQSVIRYVV